MMAMGLLMKPSQMDISTMVMAIYIGNRMKREDGQVVTSYEYTYQYDNEGNRITLNYTADNDGLGFQDMNTMKMEVPVLRPVKMIGMRMVFLMKTSIFP